MPNETAFIDMIRNFVAFYPTGHIGNLIQGIPYADARAVFVLAFGEDHEAVAEVDRYHSQDE